MFTSFFSVRSQLALYAQKFDEFQATLAKSNEIYVRFKQEMDNVSGFQSHSNLLTFLQLES